MTSHGQFHWNELMSRDAARDKRFYHDTIGWTFEAVPMDEGRTYWVANMDGTPVAGIFPLDTPEFEDVQPGWMPYLAVDDVDARAAKAVSAGAQLMRPIFDVPKSAASPSCASPAEPGSDG
jgi:predicted enzyme related to lactoylglutathione lyase